MAITINGNNAATAGGIGYGDGTNLVFTTAGTSGQILTSAGSGAPTWSSLPTVNLTTGVTGTLPIANGGTNTTATPTAGAVPYGTGTALAYTAAGTSGQVLTSAGSGAPTWTTPSAGAMTLISTKTASSSASLEWTGLSGYANYLIVYQNLVPAASNYLYMQLGTGAGPTYVSTGYQNYVYGVDYGGSFNNGGWQNSSVFYLQLTANTVNASGPGISGFLFISGMTSGMIASYSGQSSFINGLGTTNQSTSTMGGTLTGNTTAKTALKLGFTSSSNITTGTASLYGIST